MDTEVLTYMAIAVAAVAVLVISYVLHRKRVAALTDWAMRRGWRYQQRRNRLARAFPGEPFGRGRMRRALHVVSGSQHDHEVTVFEYRFKTRKPRTGDSNTRSYRTHVYEVVAVKLPAMLPWFEASREHLGHKLMNMVGMEDLQVGHDRFDSTFRVCSDDKRFARAALDDDMARWMLDHPYSEWPFRITGTHIISWRKGRLDPDRAVGSADYLIGFLSRLPHRVWPQAVGPRRD